MKSTEAEAEAEAKDKRTVPMIRFVDWKCFLCSAMGSEGHYILNSGLH